MLDGSSLYLVPDYYDMTIYYNSDNGIASSTVCLGGIFKQWQVYNYYGRLDWGLKTAIAKQLLDLERRKP